MVREITGDLLSADALYICHQTNFQGVMGGGVALAIWNKLLDAQERERYVVVCGIRGRKLLGDVQELVYQRADGKIGFIENLFCQDDRVQPDGGFTRYDCMRTCLDLVRHRALLKRGTVALPGHMGCGIAGGNWDTVRKIIEDVFGESLVDCVIVHRGRA